MGKHTRAQAQLHVLCSTWSACALKYSETSRRERDEREKTRGRNHGRRLSHVLSLGNPWFPGLLPCMRKRNGSRQKILLQTHLLSPHMLPLQSHRDMLFLASEERRAKRGERGVCACGDGNTLTDEQASRSLAFAANDREKTSVLP